LEAQKITFIKKIRTFAADLKDAKRRFDRLNDLQVPELVEGPMSKNG
jgi:hypothetical protein